MKTGDILIDALNELKEEIKLTNIELKEQKKLLKDIKEK